MPTSITCRLTQDLNPPGQAIVPTIGKVDLVEHTNVHEEQF